MQHWCIRALNVMIHEMHRLHITFPCTLHKRGSFCISNAPFASPTLPAAAKYRPLMSIWLTIIDTAKRKCFRLNRLYYAVGRIRDAHVPLISCYRRDNVPRGLKTSTITGDFAKIANFPAGWRKYKKRMLNLERLRYMYKCIKIIIYYINLYMNKFN